MIEQTFKANRISRKNNMLFPDKITIRPDYVIYEKGDIIGLKKMIINKRNISSVYLDENILFAVIIIESNGGEKITASGFSKTDARQILDLLTNQ